MSQRLDGRLLPDRIAGPGAAVGDVLVWDGNRWVPGESFGLAYVGTTAPADPPTGRLWYDTDDTC